MRKSACILPVARFLRVILNVLLDPNPRIGTEKLTNVSIPTTRIKDDVPRRPDVGVYASMS